MAISFNGTTDRIDFANPFTASETALTISVWARPITGTEGYFTNIERAAAGGYGVGFRAEGTGLSFFRIGGTNKYRVSSTAWTNAVWQHMLVIDGNTFTDATQIHMFIDNAEVAYQTTTNGATEDTTITGTMTIGGRVNDDSRNFDGYLAELAWWNRQLSADDRESLSKGYSPLFFPYGLQSYVNLIRPAQDVITGDVGSLDGTTVVEHYPYIIYPYNARVASWAGAETEGFFERGIYRGITRGVLRGK